LPNRAAAFTMGSMRLRTALVGASVLLSFVATTPLAEAGSADVTRRGSCSGRGEWKLRVRHETATTIRVRFQIDRLDTGDTWQLFLSDNGTRILSASRTVGSDGQVRAVKVTSNRPGDDRIKGSGVNTSASGSCDGSLTYRA
jgi:hypothetical protein